MLDLYKIEQLQHAKAKQYIANFKQRDISLYVELRLMRPSRRALNIQMALQGMKEYKPLSDDEKEMASMQQMVKELDRRLVNHAK